MNNLKILAAVALCMAYVAGIVTGWVGYTLAGENPPPREERGSWLTHTLQLDDAQKAEMETIWSRDIFSREGDDTRSRIRALYDARNSEVRALLDEEQQAAFDDIYRSFEEKKGAISEERRKRYDEAVAKTMAILTPEQQGKYQKILDDFEKRGPRRDHGSPDWRPKN